MNIETRSITAMKEAVQALTPDATPEQKQSARYMLQAAICRMESKYSEPVRYNFMGELKMPEKFTEKQDA